MMRKKKRMLATALVAAMVCSSGIIASADSQYDTNYDFYFDRTDIGYDSSPPVFKLGNTNHAWVMQYSLQGPVPNDTTTNVMVVEKNERTQITNGKGVYKGLSTFLDYTAEGIRYQGNTVLRANSYRTGYTITGTWNPNITW